MIKKQWTIWDYLQDASGIILKSFYGPTIVLGVLWIAGFIGLFNRFIPGLQESLYSFGTLSYPLYFLALLFTIPFDIYFHKDKITFRHVDVGRPNYRLNLILYSMWIILSIGFGVIFGTLGLFADSTHTIYDYLYVVCVSLSFSNVTAIIARAYLHDSPIAEFFIKHFRKILHR